MRTETITKTYLTFDELNAGQKVKALDKYRNWNVEHDWYDDTLKDRKKILELLGFDNVKISFSGFWSQGDGACFTGTFSVPKSRKEYKARIAAVKEYAPKFDLHGFGSMNILAEDETLEVFKIGPWNYSHSNTVRTDSDDLTQFVRAFSDALYRDLENEYNYLISDESVQESLEINGVEFDLDQVGA